MRLVITGGHGFLGWHVRVLAHSLGLPEPLLVGRADLGDPVALARLIDGTDRLLHLAGVNRGDVQENVRLAEAVACGLKLCPAPPKTVVFSNSTQTGTDYAAAKACAAQRLCQAADAAGASLEDVRLPNLFGEHGRPHYNSFVATFCRVLADGGQVSLHEDRELELWHATNAAALLLGLDPPHSPQRRTVSEVAALLAGFAGTYRHGELPALADDFEVHLFNTYRSHCVAGRGFTLTRHRDSRGELVEAVKAHGAGQTFCSSTHPAITRGQHYHLSKVERFVVVKGDAEIRMRRLFHEEVVRIRVTGSDPVAVDMPTMWAHDITNIGRGELLTLFWANQIFDPQDPDTYPEKVA